MDHLADKIKPLTLMLKNNKSVRLSPTGKEIECFEKLKILLTTAPILRCPDYNREFFISCDASGLGVGAILEQEFDGRLLPIAYASSSFSDAQLSWAIQCKECFSMIYALQKFDSIICNQAVTIITDHSPLTYLMENAQRNPKVGRWSLALQRYNIKNIQYKAGRLHQNVDILSRLPAAV